MNGIEKQISYKLTRKITYRMEDGFYTEDPTTGKEKGYFFDNELPKLFQGEFVKRTIEEVRGDHDFFTRRFRPPTEEIYERLFRIEGTGKIRDDDLPTYPFDQGQNIKIAILKLADNIIKISIKAI